MKRKSDEVEMKGKSHQPSPFAEGDDTCVARFIRDQRPLHYTLKINSFSLLKEVLAKSELERFESQKFDAGGFKWRLALYPNGDEKRDGVGHISLYLIMAENDILSTSKVNVLFTFLVYDNLRDKCLTIQDGKVRRFHTLKTEWGFTQLLSLNTFNEASNGFLVDDCCSFGVDVVVMKCEGKGEVFSLIKEPKNNEYTWKIRNFSKLDKSYYESDLFTVEGYNWKIVLYPKGVPQVKHHSLSLFLLLDDSTAVSVGSKVYIEFKIVVKNQHSSLLHQKRAHNGWLEFDKAKGWGSASFMSLKELMEPSKGFILNDLLIVTAKVGVVAALKSFS